MKYYTDDEDIVHKWDGENLYFYGTYFANDDFGWYRDWVDYPRHLRKGPKDFKPISEEKAFIIVLGTV